MPETVPRAQKIPRGARFCLPVARAVPQNGEVTFLGFAQIEKRNPVMSNDPEKGDDVSARPDGSVARAIAGYQNGNADELGEMLQTYFNRLLTTAKAKLGSFPHTDHEGLVQSTLRSFLNGARNGQYPAMNHRDELLRLLGTIMQRKVAHQVRDQTTEIAGGGRVHNEPECNLAAEGNEPDPLEQAICSEWLEHMDKKGLIKEARLIWEGYRYYEIADRLGITESKARRTITLVHKQTEIFFGLKNE
jgi:DNA-directed RNA polymerase specialized sigma24 family protein